MTARIVVVLTKRKLSRLPASCCPLVAETDNTDFGNNHLLLLVLLLRNNKATIIGFIIQVDIHLIMFLKLKQQHMTNILNLF